jgi:hypothetical protein
MYYSRNLSLFSELYGADQNYPAAPQSIPTELLSAFTMDGAIPVESGYVNMSYPARYADILRDEDVERYLSVMEGDVHRTPELREAVTLRCHGGVGHVDTSVSEMLQKMRLQRADVAVVGSVNLYLESLAYKHGARSVTSIRTQPFRNKASRLKVCSIEEWESHGQNYDVVISVSIVESIGLGMRGEPLEVDADLRLMKRLQRMTKPEGCLILTLPIGRDRLMFNTMRIYGDIRLPRVLDGWVQVDGKTLTRELLEGRGDVPSVICLQHESGSVAAGRLEK